MATEKVTCFRLLPIDDGTGERASAVPNIRRNRLGPGAINGRPRLDFSQDKMFSKWFDLV